MERNRKYEQTNHKYGNRNYNKKNFQQKKKAKSQMSSQINSIKYLAKN